jgi:hypothetical protein
MGVRTVSQCGPASLIQASLGDAYENVRLVADNLDDVNAIAESIKLINSSDIGKVETAGQVFVDKAKEWATNGEDLVVDNSEYSAKHYSIKASKEVEKASKEVEKALDGSSGVIWGVNYVGSFTEGFVYTNDTQVARGQDNKYYRYIGSLSFPVSVPAGTVPSSYTSDYKEDTIEGRLSNSTSHLKALPRTNLVNGRQFNVVGFYENTTVGGGQFIYDATRSVADHNGGTVIAASAIAAWDGSSLNIATLLDWTGTGVGCFVRVEGSKRIVCFGGIADNLTDNVKPYYAARKANENSTVYFDASVTPYRISKALNVLRGEGVRSIGGTAEILATGDHDIFYVTGSSKIRGFKLSTLGDRLNLSTNGIHAFSATGNMKLEISDLIAGSSFNTFIKLDSETDQSVIHDITSFKNHLRGVIDSNAPAEADAPTGAMKIYNVWSTPTDYVDQVPSLFGIRLGRNDCTEISNCIINDNQNDILIDNQSGSLSNWTTKISTVHSENRNRATNKIRPNTWAASQSVSIGDRRIPTKEKANGYVYRALNSGTTGATEPTWESNPKVGAEVNVVDNGITWAPDYSMISIRVNKTAGAAISVDDCQIDNHLIAINDVGVAWTINNMRIINDVHYWYKRTLAYGSNTNLVVNNSRLLGNQTMVVGSDLVALSGIGNTFSNYTIGQPTFVDKNVGVQNGQEYTLDGKKNKSLALGVLNNYATFTLAENSSGVIFVDYTAEIRDGTSTVRAVRSGRLSISFIKVPLNIAQLAISDSGTVVSQSGINDIVMSASASASLITLGCTPTTDRSSPLSKITITKVVTNKNAIVELAT